MSKSAATRAHIIAATKRLLERRDRPISMAAIAREAGVTRQLLYFHFKGRTDLLLELSRAIDAEVRTPDLQKRIDEAPNAREALRAMVAVQGEIKPKLHQVASAIDHLRATDESARAAWNERERARFERVFSVIQRLEHEEILTATIPVKVAARLAWSITSQHAWADLVVDGDWSTDEWVSHTTVLLERTLLDADAMRKDER